jgi:uncharacterized membrane protein YfhO
MARKKPHPAGPKRRQSARPREPIPRRSSLEDRLKGKMLWLFAGVLGLTILGAFWDYLFGNKTYLFKDIGSDSLNGLYPQLVHTASELQRWMIPGWSFNQGLGQNVYPNTLGEPFSWILYALKPEMLERGIAWVEILKVATAGFLFYWFLRLRNASAFTAALISLCYAFCGTMIVGGGWSIFSTHAVHAALLLVAFEMLLQGRRIWLFPLAVALITAFNIFYAYLFGIFLLAYLPLRILEIGRQETGKVSKLLAKVAGLGVIGLALSAVFSLPSLLEILLSPRGHGEASYAARLLHAPIFRLGDATYYGTLVLRLFSSDMLGTGSQFRGWANYMEAPMYYCGLLTLLLVPHVFLARSGTPRRLYAIAGAIILAVQVVPWLRHGFWLFTGDYFRTLSLFFSILLLLYAARALDSILKGGLNAMLLLGTLVLLLVLLYFPYFPREQAIARVDATLQAGAAGFLLVYFALLIALSKPNLRIYAQVALLIVVGFELMLFTRVSVGRRDVVTTDELQQKTGYNDYATDALEIIRRQDAGFFRVEKNFASSPATHPSLNDGKVQGYFGTTSYHSFNQLNYIRFLGGMGVIDPKDEAKTRYVTGLRERPFLQTFASLRYWIVRGDYTREPFLVNSYTLLGNTGDLSVLKNKFFVPLGFGVEQYVRESVHRVLDPPLRDAVLLQAFVVPDSVVGEYLQFTEWRPPAAPAPYGFDTYSADARRSADNALTGLEVGHNRVTGRISNAKPQMLVFSFPFDMGWEASVDGRKAPLKMIDYGLNGLAVSPGQHTILLRYRPPMRATGLLVSLFGLIALAGIGIVSRVSRRRGPREPGLYPGAR